MPDKPEVELTVDPHVIEEFRKRMGKEFDIENEMYHPKDIKRIQEEDNYCRDFILHQDSMTHKKDNVDAAINMAKEALKWRKSFGANEIREDNLPKEFFENGVSFPYNADKTGSPIFILKVRLHKKKSEETNHCRRFVLYWIERLLRESESGKVTVMFDCAEAGISNLDMDLIRFIVNLFKYYIPNSLSYILVFDMPWLFNAAWKIIKSWLPKEAVEKIKFLNKTTIKEFVDDDKLQVEMGGTDTHEYKHVSESTPAETA